MEEGGAEVENVLGLALIGVALFWFAWLMGDVFVAACARLH